MTPINFKANYIKRVDIQKHDGQKYNPCKANLVLLNREDIPALEEVADIWGTNLCRGIKYAYEHKLPNEKLYAVTLQNHSFENLYPNKVLGVAYFNEHSDSLSREIEYLHTRPDCISPAYQTTLKKIKKLFQKLMFRNKQFVEKQPAYKHVGQSLVSSMKELYPDKPIILYPLSEAISFYKKNGFIKKNELMVWVNKNKMP